MFDLSSHIERDLRLHSWEVDSRVATELRDEQARLIWSQAHLMLALGLAVGCALVAAQWPVLEAPLLISWLLVLLAMSGIWAGFIWYYQKKRSVPGSGAFWIQMAAGCTLFYGLVWAAAALLLFPAEILAHQAILTVMLAGVCAGAIAILAALSAGGVLIVVLSLVPLAYQFALERTESALLILSILLVLMLTLILASRHLYQTLLQSLRLRIEKSLSEAALHESETRYRLLFRNIPLGVLHYDEKGEVLDCNDMSREILGVDRAEILGGNLLDSSRPDAMVAAVQTSLEEGWGYFEDRMQWYDGAREFSLRAFFNGIERPDQSHMGGVGILEDFSTRKEAEEAIRRMAYFDPLTDLPNRRLVHDRLTQSLASAKRHQHFGALIFLDIDYFKRINDWLGHANGDTVLQTVAARLRRAVRAEDTPARLSGDEFILLLSDIGQTEASAERSVTAVCKKLQAQLQLPIPIGEQEVRMTVSMGVRIFPGQETTAEALLSHADTAMYRAKRAVRGDIRFFRPGTDEAEGEAVGLENDLAFALERDELLVEYQAMRDADERLLGAEALARWEHPEHGRIPPDRFIRIAEESGLIIPIGHWIIDQACRILTQVPAERLPQLSVNVSARQFHHREFVATVQQCIEKHGVEPDRLVFEVTENVLIDYMEPTVEKMQALRRLGVRFEVDDFGTGYSSLTYLKRLPVCGVKIDRTFVRDVETDSSDAAIVEAILAMASHLGLYAVAEGVENREQLGFLKEHGCQRFQGFLWGRPGALEGFVEPRKRADSSRAAT